MADTQEQTTEEQAQEEMTEAQKAEFADVEEKEVSAEETNLDILLDINMPIDVNIGKTEIPFKKLLQLGPGAVLQLEKAIGQPADLYVQDIKFATGDIVVVDGCFAVRIKDVLGLDETKQIARTQNQE